jgi:ubiquinone/menaquinone biosynthesis C-methylase UbiE
VLDVGCGEGQVTRLAGARGAGSIGVDPTWAQLTAAVRRDGGPAYAAASAHRLPFRDESFDAVVACLVFEHIPDADAAIAEVARVLEPGGRFVFLLNHPLLQAPGSGWIDDHILMEQYWRIGPYLAEDTTMEEVDKGVVLPAPPPGFLAIAEEYDFAATIPRLLLMRADKR